MNEFYLALSEHPQVSALGVAFFLSIVLTFAVFRELTFLEKTWAIIKYWSLVFIVLYVGFELSSFSEYRTLPI